MKKVIFLILFFSSSFLYGQVSDTIKDRYWVNFGAQIGFAKGDFEGVVASTPEIGFCYAKGNAKYSVRYSVFRGDILFNGKNYDRFNRFDLLYGRGIVRRGYYFMLSGGITLFQDVTYYKVRDDLLFLSFPIELELFLKATKYGGFGASISIDLGPKMQTLSIGGRYGFGRIKG